MNLGEGALPHGSAEREAVVAVLLSAIRDYLADGDREARAWLASPEAADLCLWIGYPPANLIARLDAIAADPAQLPVMQRLLHRKRPADIFELLRTA